MKTGLFSQHIFLNGPSLFMYKIHTLENHLLVEFKEDFDYSAVRAIIHH